MSGDDDDIFDDGPDPIVSERDGTTQTGNRWARSIRDAQPGEFVPGGTHVDTRQYETRGTWRAGADPTAVGSRELPTDPRRWQAGNPSHILESEKIPAVVGADGRRWAVDPTVLDYDPRDPRSIGGTREAAPLFLLESLISQGRPLAGQISPDALTVWMKRRALGLYGEVDGAPIPSVIQAPPRRMLQLLARHPEGGPVLAWANDFNRMLGAYAQAGYRVVAT